jgi:hypothetical protein
MQVIYIVLDVATMALKSRFDRWFKWSLIRSGIQYMEASIYEEMPALLGMN